MTALYSPELKEPPERDVPPLAPPGKIGHGGLWSAAPPQLATGHVSPAKQLKRRRRKGEGGVEKKLLPLILLYSRKMVNEPGVLTTSSSGQ